MRTNGVCADGEVVWSWRSDAGAKVVKTLSRLTGDGGTQAWSPRRARRKPLKPLRREGRLFGSYLWFLPRAFHSHGGHGCGQHPAFPAPSLNREGESFAKLGRASAARLRACALNAVAKGKPACARFRPRSHGRCQGKIRGQSMPIGGLLTPPALALKGLRKRPLFGTPLAVFG